MDKYYLTKERFEELEKELDALKNEKRREVADRLKQAKEFGDLSENSEYTEAREEQSRVEIRISELDDIIKKAAIIKSEKKSASDSVFIGSTVTVKRDDSVFTYRIVGSNEAKPEEGRISNESPLGRAFLDRKVGEKVMVVTPGGKADYQIMKIE
ncbi:MAG: transcription elongation factor GreA [Candidatus Liptonbacteria bacterium]|nr:transcription elongation factor GreA [Candidatus Liptonbacteria bacterium]